jgi:hypothetical protein
MCWSCSDPIPEHVQVVGAPLESLCELEFQTMIQKLKDTHRLFAIVIDKASSFMKDSDWRNAYVDAVPGLLSVRDVPLYLMMATCSPSQEARLWAAAGVVMDQATVMTVLRSPTTQQDIFIHAEIQSQKGESAISWRKSIIPKITQQASNLNGDKEYWSSVLGKLLQSKWLNGWGVIIFMPVCQ